MRGLNAVGGTSLRARWRRDVGGRARKRAPPGAHRLRQAAERPAGAPVPAGGDGDQSRGIAMPPWSSRGGTRPTVTADAVKALRHGQTVRHRPLLRRRQRGPADARRLRLPVRVRHRAGRPRPAGAPDPRGDQRDHAAHRGPGPSWRARHERRRGTTERPVLVSRRGGLALLTLNRPRAINALTHEMVRILQSALDAWAQDPDGGHRRADRRGERGLCAGGDIVSIYRDPLAAAATRSTSGATSTSSTLRSRLTPSRTSP